jgi:hypothetical protein
MCTRKGLLPKGASTTFTIASAAAETSASTGNLSSPYKTREDVQNSPNIGKLIPPSKAAQWSKSAPKPDPMKYGEYLVAREQLMFNVMKVMADNKLDARSFRLLLWLIP